MQEWRARGCPFAAVHVAREELRELRYAAVLHDFGKVGVREEVLAQVPASFPMLQRTVQGFASVQVVNTDTGFQRSNSMSALLQGNPLAGIPTLNTINGMVLAPSSSDPHFATDNVETVVAQGTTVKLGGTGFDTANGVAADIFCACPPSGKITKFFNPGDPHLTSTLIMYPLPAKG